MTIRSCALIRSRGLVKRSRSNRLPIIVASILILVVGIGFYQAVVVAKDEQGVVVAKQDLAAYSFVDQAQIEFMPVPRGSIREEDVTEDEYNELYGDEGMVLTAQVLAGQRVDEREVASGPQQSFSVVLPDERVVAASTTATGAAVGTVQAGDVVDVSSEGGLEGTGPLIEFAKVICIASTPSGCQGVLPPGVDLSVSGGSEEGSISLLLAVPRESATTIAGQNVTLALNPFCRVDRTGHFYTTREGAEEECQAGDRMAAEPSGADVVGESAAGQSAREG
jgi:hypothetical protein